MKAAARDRMRLRMTRGVLLAIRVIVLLTPARLHVPIARGIGTLLWRGSAHHRRTVKTHLRMAFGDQYTEEELEGIGLRADRNMVMNVFEFARFPQFTKEDVRRMVRVEGKERIDEALKAGKGCIVVAAHYGNWELLAAWIATHYTMTVVGRDQEDSLLNDIIVSLRTSRGTRSIPRGTPVFKHIMNALKNNELVGLVADQNAGPYGLFVDFFGSKASAFKGPGLFSVLSGAPVVPICIVREGYEKHRGYFYPPVRIEPSGDAGRDVSAVCQGYTAGIEDMVRRHPDHWLWQHKRWKTRPPGEDEGPVA